jgi:hypothetical protein
MHPSPGRPHCAGSGQLVPPQQLPSRARLHAGLCPVCGQVRRRDTRTGAMGAHPPPRRRGSTPRRPDATRGRDEPVHLAAPEAPEEPADRPSVPPGLLQCQECTILIGPGYLETEPFAHPAREGVVCWRCFESLERRAARGDAAVNRSAAALRDPWWHG